MDREVNLNAPKIKAIGDIVYTHDAILECYTFYLIIAVRQGKEFLLPNGCAEHHIYYTALTSHGKLTTFMRNSWFDDNTDRLSSLNLVREI